MSAARSYFLCGIGGSGMLPLAMILKAAGHEVAGSDRSLDQGRTGDKFEWLKGQGIRLFPQDGSGIVSARQILVCSAAVEETVPDVQKARRLGAPLVRRAELLAELFNASPTGIAVAGTSGKSTTTGMIGWILHAAGKDPTMMNGAVMKNFVTPDAPFASALVGKSGIFVSEVDESDGSIEVYSPRIGVLNNIALDHKSMDELRGLFSRFIARAEVAVLNLDNEETAALAGTARGKRVLTYSFANARADLVASNLVPERFGVGFDVSRNGKRHKVRLAIPGAHNVANALAALCAAEAAGVPLAESAASLGEFSGIRRRLELVGAAGGVTVIDDFAHNPDKIAATLTTLHQQPGRLLIMFQPHGFGPLRLMKDAFIDSFARLMNPEDVLIMPAPVYLGGTTDRSVSSQHIVSGVMERGRHAFSFETREECGAKLLALAGPGDVIAVMGARDDTLSVFATQLLSHLPK